MALRLLCCSLGPACGQSVAGLPCALRTEICGNRRRTTTLCGMDLAGYLFDIHRHESSVAAPPATTVCHFSFWYLFSNLTTRVVDWEERLGVTTRTHGCPQQSGRSQLAGGKLSQVHLLFKIPQEQPRVYLLLHALSFGSGIARGTDLQRGPLSTSYPLRLH